MLWAAGPERSATSAKKPVSFNKILNPMRKWKNLLANKKRIQ
jgi:hypothetical protein